MIKLIKMAFLVLTISNPLVQASAGEKSTNQNFDFAAEIKQFNYNCDVVVCRSPYEAKTIYRFSDEPLKPIENFKVFKQIAFDQAQIWADTILEGDFIADGDTRVDRIYKLFKNKEFIGYLVTYSETAWQTSDCQYDGIHSETLAGCTRGRIIESSFVSPQLTDYFYTEKTMAVFK